MDGLVDASKEPFFYYYECPMPFRGSPTDMVHHLMDACSGHYWPLAENIKYETCYLFTMPVSLEDHRHLLVTKEDNNVFLLAVGTGKAHAGHHPVSMCASGPMPLTLTRGRCTSACSLLLPLWRTRATSAPPSRLMGCAELLHSRQCRHGRRLV